MFFHANLAISVILGKQVMLQSEIDMRSIVRRGNNLILQIFHNLRGPSIKRRMPGKFK